MPWVKIDDHFDEHPKLQQVGPLGWGVWLAGLAYCNRNLTDGFIPWTKARSLCSFEVVEDDGKVWSLSRSCGMAGDDIDAEWVIRLLVDAGLWDVVENGRGRIDGYRVHDYDGYQPSKEEVLAERAKNAERQARHRQRKAESHDDTNDVVTDNVTPLVTDDKRYRNERPVPVPVPVPVPDPEPEPKEDSGSHEPARSRVVSDTPFSVYQTFIDETAAADFTPAPKWKDKQIGIAARLLEQGYGDDKVRRCVRYMQSQAWRTSPFDLGGVEKYIGTWEANGMPERDQPKRGSPQRTREPDFTGIDTFTEAWKEAIR